MSRIGYDPLKRAIDLLGSVVMLVVTLPIQAVLALAVRRRMGTPVLFRQERPGRDEKIFTLVKFRTMSDPDPEVGLITDDERLTPFGIFLRSTSLDELPTLWNVLRGDMSLVGPRPLLVKYLNRYSPEQRRRHEVRPGITGLTQIRGRNSIAWDEKFLKDIEYVDNRSLVLDVQILLGTFKAVILRRGISDTHGPTMSEFAGSAGSDDG